MSKEYLQKSCLFSPFKRENRLNFLQKREYLSQIWMLAFPLILENTLQTFLGTVDRFFASSIEESAIAAIGVSEIVTNLYLAIFLAINVGVSVAMGKSFGKNDVNHGNKVIVQGFFLSVFFGLLVGVISLLFGEKFLSSTRCTDEILSYALPYFMTVAVPSVFLSVSLTLSACLRATKDTKTPMILSTLCNILNIFLNIVFLTLNLGMFGIGLATSISRFLLAVGLFSVLLLKQRGIHLSFRNHPVDLPVLKEICTIGLPAAGEKLAMRLGQLSYTAIILSLGTEAYVAHTLTATIENYIYIPIFAFSTTTSILVSISLGEGNPEKARDYVSMTRQINTPILLCFSFTFVFFGEIFIGFFTDSQQVISETYDLLVILACAVPFMGILHIYTSALQGSGDSKTPMFTTLFGIWVIRLGVGFFSTQVLRLGISGFWLVITLDSILRAFFLNRIYTHKSKLGTF